ncbi:dUTP pyrophosphatase [Jannaschia faecimaris]|uniref:Deoxyuridine 5'-triphosphate nucleotidohydrolase n=1 Tax=Jannaschia faecimaris TaxID=1244108 RepID=A0A1H3SZM7_9RHOB|nr:dUTP diphosphatase [Jannaschia faecimaris]SDZ43486.1 dUTP pyrophosphatase [Jannaschia faecimaris]
MSVTIEVIRTPGSDPNLPLPAFATPGAAGADIHADTGGKTVTLSPGTRALIGTGLRMAIPQGYEVQVRPRSGLALKHGVTLANAPGTIDSDYRGPLGVILINLGDVPFDVTHGMRIAQLVVAPVAQAHFEIVATLDQTDRGAGGFGSTGIGHKRP